MFSYHLNKKAFAAATIATLILIALVFIGSRKVRVNCRISTPL